MPMYTAWQMSLHDDLFNYDVDHATIGLTNLTNYSVHW